MNTIQISGFNGIKKQSEESNIHISLNFEDIVSLKNLPENTKPKQQAAEFPKNNKKFSAQSIWKSNTSKLASFLLMAMAFLGMVLGSTSSLGDETVIITETPPQPNIEVRAKSPGDGYVWISGYWQRRGNEWTWNPGYWKQPPQSEMVWIPGRWVKKDSGWYWMDGQWKVLSKEVLIIRESPPASRVETMPSPAPSSEHVWIPGHWIRRDNDWEWSSGYWEFRPQREAVWVPGQWTRRDGGWFWQEGHWKVQ